MKHSIMTILGEFTVWMTYQSAADDPTLKKLTKAINDYALPFIPKGFDEDDSDELNRVLEKMSEAELEKKLFDSLRVNDGSAPRLTLALKDRKIEFQSF